MNVKEIDDEKFAEYINKDRVIVKYYANWCGVCKMFAPVYKRLSNDPKYKDVTFVEVLAEQNPKARLAAGVVSLPYIATFSRGKLVEAGSSHKEIEVKELLEDLLKKEYGAVV